MKKNILLILIVIISSTYLFSQTKIDSLETQLANAADKERTKILIDLTREYRNLDPHIAIEFGNKALVNIDNYKDELLKAIFYNDLGWAHYNLKEFQPAIEYTEKCLTISEELERITLRAYALNSLGAIYWGMNNYVKAMEIFLLALKIYEEMDDDFSIASVKNNMGLLFFSTKDFNNSLKNYFESLEIYEKLDAKMDIAKTKLNIASVYGSTNETEKALEYSLSALDYSEESGNERFTGIILTNTAITYYDDLKDLDKAQEFFNRSLIIAQKYDDKENIARAYHYIASIYKDEGKYNQALTQANNALIIAQEINDNTQITYILREISSIYSKMKNFENAYEFHLKFKASDDSLFNIESSEKITEMQTKYETEKKEHQIAILEKENKIDNMTRNYFIGGFVFVLIIAIILYNRYRMKTKANLNLSNANNTINNQNEQLQLISRILRHDIANNLYTVDRCLENFNKTDDRSCLEDVPKQVHKSTDLIQRFSKISYLINETNFVFPIDVNEILDRLIPTYEDIEIALLGKGEVQADDLFESVLDNIISNAIKHGKTEKIKIEIIPDEEWVNISIADFGKGIPEIVRDKIFEESFVYGDTGNTGLGLFIVKKAVENYGGTVTVKSNDPKGTIFELKLKKAV
jgi:tetratricopeptide (TPR) repeat protein